jgi:hypothetical protein
MDRFIFRDDQQFTAYQNRDSQRNSVGVALMFLATFKGFAQAKRLGDELCHAWLVYQIACGAAEEEYRLMNEALYQYRDVVEHEYRRRSLEETRIGIDAAGAAFDLIADECANYANERV